MAFSKFISIYNFSSQCINHNVLKGLCSIHTQKNSSIIEHEKYFVSRIVVYIFQRKKNKTATTGSDLRLKIYCMQETENSFSFHLNTNNTLLMSKWGIHRTLIKHAGENASSVESLQFPYVTLYLIAC